MGYGMINVSVLKEDEIFATLEKGGQPHVWRIIEGQPKEIRWDKLPNGDYRLKLHTEEKS